MSSSVAHVRRKYIGETGEGKTKLRDRVRVYCQHIRQPQYQQLKVKGHLRVCGNREFRIFPLLQMHSQDKNLRRIYETRFQQKFKTKLHKLWWETYARKVHRKPSIVKQLFIACIIYIYIYKYKLCIYICINTFLQ